MSGVGDLYDLSDDERLALCQELGRLTRIVPLSSVPETATSPARRPPTASGTGDSSAEQGASA